MRAAKPKILHNMDEETQTEKEGEGKVRKIKVKEEKDIDTREKIKPVSDDTYFDTQNVMYCEKHPDKKVEYYCRIHGELPCSRCVLDTHRKCQGMSLIEDIATVSRAQKDVYKVSEKLEAAAYQIDTQRQKDKTVLTHMDESVAKINLELKHHKEKIYKMTEAIENRLAKRTEKVYKERNKIITTHLDICNDTGAKLEKLKQVMETIIATENDAERFVLLQKVKKAFQSLSAPIHDLNRDAIDVQINLKLNVDIEKTLQHIDKRMQIEVKTSRRGEPTTTDKSLVDSKKKGLRNSDQDLSTPRSNKTVGKQENSHKYLAQRNFRPYKVRPYTVEKKQTSRAQLKSSGGFLSARKPKPLIVVSAENINAQATSKRYKALINTNIDSSTERHGNGTNEESLNREHIKVEIIRPNKTVPGSSKGVKYIWATQGDKGSVDNSKLGKTMVTDVSKAAHHSRYNKSMFHDFERKSKEQTSTQQPPVRTKHEYYVGRDLYRNGRQLHKQNIFEDIENLAMNKAQMNPSSKDVKGKSKNAFSKADHNAVSENAVNDSKHDHFRVNIKTDNNTIKEDGSKIGLNNKTKVVTSVTRKSDNAHITVSFKEKQNSNGKTKNENLETVTETPTDDTKAKKDSDKKHKEEHPNYKSPQDATKIDRSGTGKAVKSNGNVGVNNESSDQKQMPENNNENHFSKVNNHTTEPGNRSNQSNPLNNIENNASTNIHEEASANVMDNQTTRYTTGDTSKNLPHTQESHNRNPNGEDKNDSHSKAFVTDVSIDSENQPLSEKSIDRLIKTKSADRLRVRTSSSSRQRAKSGQ